MMSGEIIIRLRYEKKEERKNYNLIVKKFLFDI